MDGMEQGGTDEEGERKTKRIARQRGFLHTCVSTCTVTGMTKHSSHLQCCSITSTRQGNLRGVTLVYGPRKKIFVDVCNVWVAVDDEFSIGQRSQHVVLVIPRQTLDHSTCRSHTHTSTTLSTPQRSENILQLLSCHLTSFQSVASIQNSA